MTMKITLIAPDTMNLPEGAKAVGLEYAVRRVENRTFLADPNLDGTDARWEYDDCNATWLQNVDDAWWLADRFRLTDPDEERDMLDGYQIVARPWFYEEDLIDSYDKVPLNKLDFTALGITPADFEQ